MRDKLKEIQYELPKGRDDKHDAEKHVSACPSAEFSAPENKMPFNMPRLCRWSELLSRCSRLSACYRVMHTYAYEVSETPAVLPHVSSQIASRILGRS